MAALVPHAGRIYHVTPLQFERYAARKTIRIEDHWNDRAIDDTGAPIKVIESHRILSHKRLERRELLLDNGDKIVAEWEKANIE